MRVGRFQFRAGLVPSIVYLLLLPLLLALGVWQLDRARFKEELGRAFEQGGQRGGAANAVNLGRDWARLDAGDPAFRFRIAFAEGVYDQRHFLLDNRTHEGRAGYHVLTALALGGTAPAIVVNRGWHPWGGDRSALPALDAPGGAQSTTGRLAAPPGSGLLLGDDGFGAKGWPRVIQRFDRASVEAALGFPVLPVLLMLDASAPGGYVRQWRANSGIGPHRHRGYAVQWFALAAALTVIYLVVNTRRAGRPE